MSIIASIGSTLLGAVGKNLSKVNRSQEADCIGAVTEAGMTVQQALARYPQCQPYAGVMGGGGQYQPPPYMPLPPPSVAGGAYSNGGLRQISYGNGNGNGGGYRPAMTLPGMALRALPTIPQLGAMAGRYTGQALSVLKRSLPTLKRDLAIASGFSVVGSLIYDQAGNLVGKTRRRRRINPLNYRAAMRAASRLCKVQDLTARIQQALPVASSPKKRFRKRRRKTCR